jgi:hypothetical protein
MKGEGGNLGAHADFIAQMSCKLLLGLDTKCATDISRWLGQ